MNLKDVEGRIIDLERDIVGAFERITALERERRERGWDEPTPTIERFELWEYSDAGAIQCAWGHKMLPPHFTRHKVGGVVAERHSINGLHGPIWQVMLPTGFPINLYDDQYQALKNIGAFVEQVKPGHILPKQDLRLRRPFG